MGRRNLVKYIVYVEFSLSQTREYSTSGGGTIAIDYYGIAVRGNLWNLFLGLQRIVWFIFFILTG